VIPFVVGDDDAVELGWIGEDFFAERLLSRVAALRLGRVGVELEHGGDGRLFAAAVELGDDALDIGLRHLRQLF
jgi:hypothetical protein